MNANIAALLYLASGVLFILALRGLSSPATSQAGARNGMIGMAIAVGTTLWLAWTGEDGLDATTLGVIVGGIAVGGIIGAIVARRIPMTAMPQLVAFFHSLVGLA
ncbi:MAG: NAD(P)(+) transhydrogenase (Re/Si-specific) subunit beta, partial [Alphaproteobacteria bacterium]|nr:NAD(P)(+) transhydrogenase (Re/Si-specific) subunit beta [Alphaproteobacteria bacterium]